MVQRPKPDAVAKPAAFNDSLTPAEVAAVEASGSHLGDVLSAILTQLKRIQVGNGAGDWKDDPAGKSLAELSASGGGITVVANWTALAGIASPADYQTAIVVDPSDDPDVTGLAGPLVYTYLTGVWAPFSVLSELQVTSQGSGAGVAVSTLDGGAVAFDAQLNPRAGLISADEPTVDLNGPAVFGNPVFDTTLSYRSPRQPTALPMDDNAGSGGIGSLPGGPYASVAASIRKGLVISKAANFDRFMSLTTPQFIHVNPSGGNDTSGDGLTAGTAYATIQRAIDDIPNGFKTDIVIQLAAGSFAGQNFHCPVVPGFRTGSTQAIIYVTGDQTSAFTFASSGAGTLLAGKSTQVQYTVAHGLTITDGSHWLMTSVAGQPPATTRVLRASSTTQIVSVQSSTVPVSNQKICAYNTTFTSSFSASSVRGPSDAPFLRLVGLKIDAPGIMTNILISGSRLAGGTYQNCNVFSGVFTSSAGFIDYGQRFNTMFNALFLGGATITGPRGSTQQCVFSNTGNPALALGTTGFSSPPVPAHPGSGIRLATSLDFEGSGVGIMATGNAYFIGAGPLTFALTNRAVDAAHGALFASSSNHTWSGTVTGPCLLRSRAWFNKTGITYSVANTTTPGADFNVGAAATVVAASGSVMDLVDLATFQ